MGILVDNNSRNNSSLVRVHGFFMLKSGLFEGLVNRFENWKRVLIRGLFVNLFVSNFMSNFVSNFMSDFVSNFVMLMTLLVIR